MVTEPGGWAVLKLFSAWQHECEPRLTAEGGHLYRRGHFGWLSEVGIVSSPDAKRTYKAGEKETTTLRITSVPSAATGHQMAIHAEDSSGTVSDLRRFYGSLFNGGCVNDQIHYNFGNEPDGWYYGGASWMKGLAMLAGTPGPERIASQPHDLPRAFRDNLPMITGTEFEPGRTRFGYNSAGHGAVGGAYTDDNINQILGGRAYYLYSGDLAFVRQQLPFYRRAADWYLGNRNADGLVSLTPAHWYYDAMLSSGVTTYHNAFLYRALRDLAQLELAAGNVAEAAKRETEAAATQGRYQPPAVVGGCPGRSTVCGLDSTRRFEDRVCRRPLPVPTGRIRHCIAGAGPQAACHAGPSHRRVGTRLRIRWHGVAVCILARARDCEHASSQPGLWQLHERRLVPVHDLLGDYGAVRRRRC